MISTRRSLGPIKDRAHPSSRNSSTEFLRSIPSPFIFRCSASPALGLCPSSRHHSSAATISRGASHAPLRSVLRFSQPLDGFFRSRACRLISSRNHVQGHPSSRGFSPVAATLPLRKELPPCRCCIAARTHAPTFAGSHAAHVRRLSASRPRSAPGRVLQVRLFTSPKAAPLFEFHAPPGTRSLDVGIRSHGCLPLLMLRVRSLPHARTSRWTHPAIIFEVSPSRALSRKHGDDPRAGLQAIGSSFESPFTSRNITGAVTAVAGPACFAGSSPFGCFEPEALSPAHLAVTRACGVAARIIISEHLRCRGSAHSFECVSLRAARFIALLRHFAMAKLRTIRSRTSRCERSFIRPCTPCCSCLRTSSPALRRSSPHADMLARNEAANSRVRLHLATRPSCCHVGVVAAFHVRARCTIRLSTSVHSRHVAVLRVSAFSVAAVLRPRARLGSRRCSFTLRGRAHIRLATNMTASTSCERSSAFPPRSRPSGSLRSRRPRSPP
jgi:hypothetical protein